MINRPALLSDLQKLLQRLEADLLERSESAEVPEVGNSLRAEYERAKKAERTAQNYEDWRSDAITQAAAAWVLSCVFVRFLEDNRLIDPPKIAGPADRLQRARDEHELYFRQYPKRTDRDYLLSIFDHLAALPGTKDVFGEHNPLRELPGWMSGDAAGELLRFFQKIEANTGELVHDFTDPNWDTRFLGDLYQDLSEAARKKYALLQTPEFVEEFILDRTLEPALDEFGLEFHAKAQRREEDTSNASSLLTAFTPLRDASFKMIDPACGSGHFLLGAFPRILDRWQRREPGTNVRDLVQRTLNSIHGVDVNPYAVAIARFRLLLAAMRACSITRLADAPLFRMHLACGDSLLHAPLKAGQQVLDFELTSNDAECEHAYQSEDLTVLKTILRAGQYHAVVANPPYITPKDRQLNERYRRRFRSCHMKYSLSVPFLERIFQLAVPGGYTGQITANSFMKREFGKKLIESFFPTVDLTHVIDTSGAYIPGHGTPTVILFGRQRQPVSSTLRTVMGIRGEPATPDDPAQGLVWSAIRALIDMPGELTPRRKGAKAEPSRTPPSDLAPSRERSPAHDQFVSAANSPRELFHKHPWSIGGGGAAELKERLEEATNCKLESLVRSIGITSFTLEDDIFILPEQAAKRWRMTTNHLRPMIVGDAVRDWTRGPCEAAVFPYDEEYQPIAEKHDVPSLRYLWQARTCIANNKMFGGKSKVESGLKWYEFGRLTVDKLRTPLSLVFTEVATHNHFVLDRGGKVFNRTAPVIKLPANATEDDHLALLGLLNSSTACFLLKQVCHNKGSAVDLKGARQRTAPFEDFFAFNATKIAQLPLPRDMPVSSGSGLDRLASQLWECAPEQCLTQRRKGAKEDTRTSDKLVTSNDTNLRAFAPLREPSAPTALTAPPREPSAPTASTTLTAPPHEPYALNAPAAPLRDVLESARQQADLIRRQMIAHQEELDWECYRLYGLLDEDLTLSEPPPLQLGQRAFEIVLARKMAAGETQTTWFERHSSTPITQLPAEWPEGYRRLVQRRIELIETDPNIRLIEQPEYKRRWNTEPWDEQLERAFRNWLLDRLESYFDFDGRMKDRTPRREDAKKDNDASELRAFAPLREISLVTIAQLADVARQDADFQQVGELYRDDSAFDVETLVAELVAAESVPLLPVLRYKPSGLIKRGTWERTWELQRREDAIDVRTKLPATDSRYLSEDAVRDLKQQQVGDIPVPAKYDSKDFLTSDFWRLRGKLDVPKERWISFPHCEGPDGTLVICWAGYDHLQQARAISAYYVDIQERLGGREDPRLVPLLACLLELLPWLKQWHNEIDPEYGMAMGDYFEGFINEEARQLGKTVPEIKAWTPPARTGSRRGRRSKT